MTQSERTPRTQSRENRGKWKNVVIAGLVGLVAGLTLDRLADIDVSITPRGNTSTEPMEPTPTYTSSPTATPSPTATRESTSVVPRETSVAPTATPETISEMEVLLESLDFSNLWDAFVDESRDEQPSTDGSKLTVTDPESYQTRFDIFAAAAQEDLQKLFELSPSARRFFAPVVYGGLTDWATKLQPEEAISQNFADVLSTTEGQAALRQANEMFANALVTRSINGEDTPVFRHHPGSTDAGFENLWVESPENGDGNLRSAITTTGFENLQRALYAQLTGYARRYATAHNLPWSESDFVYFADRVSATYMAGGFEPVGGYDALYYLGDDSIARQLDYTQDLDVKTRRLQMGEDITGPNRDEREDQNLEWQCIAVTEERSVEPASFPVELDGEDATWTGEITAHEVTSPQLADITSAESLAQTFITGELMNIRFWHEKDDRPLANIPTTYENHTPQEDDAETYLVYGRCAVAPEQPASATPVPEQPTQPPQQPPRTPERPEPTPEDEKSPNEDKDGDGGYGDGPIDDDQPIDEVIPTPEPLPTKPPAEATPPSFKPNRTQNT